MTFYLDRKADDNNPHKLIPISFLLKSQVSDYFYHIDNDINLPGKDKYLVQTRSQARSSGIRLLEIHGANKGLDPHMQPDKQKSFPIQTVNKGMPAHPIPKPRIGQGRAGLRRKVNTLQPMPLLCQLPTQPIRKHVQKAVVPLPEPTNQSQSHVQSQILPRPLSQHHPIDPTHIPQQIGPKIQHRPTPSEARQFLCTRTSGIERSSRYYQTNPKVLAKTDGHRQNFRHYEKKISERNTPAPYGQGDPSRILN